MNAYRKLKPFISASYGTGRTVLFLLFLSSLAGLWPAFLARVLFDRVIPYHEARLILPVLLAALTAEAAASWCGCRAERLLVEISRKGRYSERGRQSRLVWTDEPVAGAEGPTRDEGSVIQYFEDAAVLGDLRSRFLRQVVGPGMTILLLLPAMFLVCPQLSGLRLLLSVPAFAVGSLFIRKDLRQEQQLWHLRRNLAGLLVQGQRGIPTLESCGRLGFFRTRLRRSFFTLGRLEEQRGALAARWQALSRLVSRAGNALVPAAAALLILRGRLSFGSFIAFSIISGRALNAAGEVFGGLRMLSRSSNALDRRSSLEAAGGIGPSFYLGRGDRTGIGLEVCNLRFSYPGKDCGTGRKIFSGSSFAIGAGERVKLSGGNGTGKSTLFHLLLGILRPEGGELLWNGELLNSCPRDRLCRIVGGVLQVPRFFDGSIRENLCLFSPSPGERRLRQALEYAGVEDVVSRLHGGVDARIRGGGTNLSGGELQRLAIARLLLSPTPLILLDEPFTAMDPISIARAAEGFRHLAAGRTIIIVHHGALPHFPVDRRMRLRRRPMS